MFTISEESNVCFAVITSVPWRHFEGRNIMDSIMDIIIEEYIRKEIQREYQHVKEATEKSISVYEYILNIYKKEFPLRLFSIHYLKRFRDKLCRLVLLPNKDEYEKISRENELIDTIMFLPIRIGEQNYKLQIPLIVNVSKLSRYIENQNLNKVSFRIDDLLAIMTEGYQDDYERDNKNRLEKRDILFEEKKRNPIIIMQGSNATSSAIINGNHRILYYSKMEHSIVKGYYVTSGTCCKFALTKDYETLYKMILQLIAKVYGIINVEKNAL